MKINDFPILQTSGAGKYHYPICTKLLYTYIASLFMNKTAFFMKLKATFPIVEARHIGIRLAYLFYFQIIIRMVACRTLFKPKEM